MLNTEFCHLRLDLGGGDDHASLEVTDPLASNTGVLISACHGILSSLEGELDEPKECLHWIDATDPLCLPFFFEV